MTNIKSEHISFKLPSGEAKCLLFTPPQATSKLAVILPGVAYSFRQPLLHFAMQVAIAFFSQVSELFPQMLDTVVARSLGTYALACAIEAGTAKPLRIVWQTPSLRSKWPVIRSCGIPGFGILGTKDHYYDEALPHLPEDRIIVEGADHGMEVEGDPMRSIERLGTLAAKKKHRAVISRI